LSPTPEKNPQKLELQMRAVFYYRKKADQDGLSTTRFAQYLKSQIFANNCSSTKLK